MPLEKPHDKFFKETFSRPDILTDFAQACLPADILRAIDFSTLVREGDSYTDAQLSEYFVDLLFSVQYGSHSVRIALLFEHKSYTEEYPHLQLNQYLLNYWTNQVKAKKPLSPIIPIVVYHGERPWINRPFADYFDLTETGLSRFVPSFDYILINLRTDLDRLLPVLKTDYARLTALLLQHSRQQQRLLQVFTDFADVFDRLADEALGRTFIETSFVYVYWSTDLTKEQVITIFRNISRRTGTIAMTTAERLINEGIEKGIEQGIEQATVRHVKGMLKLGMDARTIGAALELPLDSIHTLIEQIQSGRV
jgi:predicted transposase/invertase (TIGR01784 family)